MIISNTDNTNQHNPALDHHNSKALGKLVETYPQLVAKNPDFFADINSYGYQIFEVRSIEGCPRLFVDRKITVDKTLITLPTAVYGIQDDKITGLLHRHNANKVVQLLPFME